MQFPSLGNTLLPQNCPEIYYFCPPGAQHATGYFYDRLLRKRRSLTAKLNKKSKEKKEEKVDDGWKQMVLSGNLFLNTC